MQKFVIIAAARTGSTLLVSLLNSSPSVKCYYELFNPRELRIDGVDRHSQIAARNAEPIKFLNEVLNESKADAAGFKIFDGHNNSVLDALIKDDSYKKIVLNRRNFLSIYSSRLISQKKALWSETTQGGKLESLAEASATPAWQETVEFKESEFWGLYNQHIDFYKRVVHELNKANQHFEYLEYGDLLNENLFRRLYPFLGADQPRKLTTNMRRNNTPNILSRFENTEETREFLRRINRLDWITESDAGWDLASAR